MAAFKRYVHPVSKPVWRPLAEIAPDMHVQAPPTGQENGHGRAAPMALAFVDPDQEMHVYIFDDNDRKALVELLTGGIVLA